MPVQVATEKNEAMNRDLRFCIEKLREHRATHVDWRDWFRKYPKDRRVEVVGDADFHNEVIQTYNSVLAVLEALLDEPATEDVDMGEKDSAP